MREQSKRTSMLSTSVVLWGVSIAATVEGVAADSAAWDAVVILVVGAAVAATIARYLMRTRHIMAQVYRVGRDAEKEERDEQ